MKHAKSNAVIRIGTSNVVVPGNKTTFPKAFKTKSRLGYYAHLFNTVEINRSFYKMPLPSTFERWSSEVPGDFRFSLKLSKEVTHQKNLPDALPVIKNFMKAAQGTGHKKGCLLLQFPASINFDYFNKLEYILKQLNSEDPQNEWRKAVEFRSNSWYVSETMEMLHSYGISAVLHDIPKGRLMKPFGEASFVYLRLHGPAGDYRGSYTENFLEGIADAVKQWKAGGKDVYVYFNNTIGDAFANARYLQSLASI